MTSDDGMRDELLKRIKAKQTSIASFIGDLEPRSTRLNTISIACSAIVSVLTAGPALGGETFTEGTQQLLSLPNEVVVWRVLCFGAMGLSIIATIATNMYKSNDVVTRLSKAQACKAELERLETGLVFGQISLPDAVKLYQQCVTQIPFVPDIAFAPLGTS